MSKIYILWTLKGEFAMPGGYIDINSKLFLNKETAIKHSFEIAKTNLRYESIYDFHDRNQSIFTNNFTVIQPNQTKVVENESGNYIIPCTGFGGKGDTMLVIQEADFEDGFELFNGLILREEDDQLWDFYSHFAYKLGYQDKIPDVEPIE